MRYATLTRHYFLDSAAVIGREAIFLSLGLLIFFVHYFVASGSRHLRNILGIQLVGGDRLIAYTYLSASSRSKGIGLPAVPLLTRTTVFTVSSCGSSTSELGLASSAYLYSTRELFFTSSSVCSFGFAGVSGFGGS